jgi:AhpC/TSA family protein
MEPVGRRPGSVHVQDSNKGGPMRIRLLLWSLVATALVSLTLVGAASALEVGQKAPDFALNGVDGKPVKLSDLTAKGPVVVYTFIAAFTPT